jgi:hypothetical protein
MEQAPAAVQVQRGQVATADQAAVRLPEVAMEAPVVAALLAHQAAVMGDLPVPVVTVAHPDLHPAQATEARLAPVLMAVLPAVLMERRHRLPAPMAARRLLVTVHHRTADRPAALMELLALRRVMDMAVRQQVTVAQA